jgi:hypothetical protein
MNALNTIVANAMENSKLGEVGFDENYLFSPPGIEEKVYVDYDRKSARALQRDKKKSTFEKIIPKSINLRNQNHCFVV